jgi:hypothetical protein
MPRKIKQIVEAETAPVVEEQAKPQAGLNFDDVGEAVIVGRYKTGEEFVISVNFDDVLKAKAYCDYGVRHYDIMIDRHLITKLKAKEQQA